MQRNGALGDLRLELSNQTTFHSGEIENFSLFPPALDSKLVVPPLHDTVGSAVAIIALGGPREGGKGAMEVSKDRGGRFQGMGGGSDVPRSAAANASALSKAKSRLR